MESYDKNRFYLGECCPLNHKWEATNKSLRRIEDKSCRICEPKEWESNVVISRRKPKRKQKVEFYPDLTEQEITEFWKQVKVTDTCWLWDGTLNANGYGVYIKKYLAHRVAYCLKAGQPIPEGMYVYHKCKNNLCLNPNHLFIGSPKDNFLRNIFK